MSVFNHSCIHHLSLVLTSCAGCIEIDVVNTLVFFDDIHVFADSVKLFCMYLCCFGNSTTWQGKKAVLSQLCCSILYEKVWEVRIKL